MKQGWLTPPPICPLTQLLGPITTLVGVTGAQTERLRAKLGALEFLPEPLQRPKLAPLTTRQLATTPMVALQFRQLLEVQPLVSCSCQPLPLAPVTPLLAGTTEPILQPPQNLALPRTVTHQAQILKFLPAGPPTPTPLASTATIQLAEAFRTSRSPQMLPPR